MYSKMQRLYPQKKRVYVKVNSDFDSTGFMLPKSITWTDGRIFRIDSVRDYRPAAAYSSELPGDCYTIIIRGQERHLFFERADPLFANRVGRWFVETSFEKSAIA